MGHQDACALQATATHDCNEHRRDVVACGGKLPGDRIGRGGLPSVDQRLYGAKDVFGRRGHARTVRAGKEWAAGSYTDVDDRSLAPRRRRVDVVSPSDASPP